MFINLIYSLQFREYSTIKYIKTNCGCFLFQILVTLFLQGLRSHKTSIFYIFRLPPSSVNPATWL